MPVSLISSRPPLSSVPPTLSSSPPLSRSPARAHPHPTCSRSHRRRSLRARTPLRLRLSRPPMKRAVLPVSRFFLRSRHAASAAEWVRTSRRAVSSKAEEKSVAATAGGKSLEKKIWGSGLELEPVTKEQAEEKYLDVTDLKRTLTPPTSVAVKARDDMLNDRFNYVSTHLSNENAYIVAGKKGAVAPAAVGQTGMALASFCVLMGAITSVVYIKTQWGVTSAKDLGDKLREKGAARREALESSGTVGLVRSISSKGEATVKEHVELVRRPSQQLGEHLDKSLKGVHRKRAEEPSP